MSQTSAIRRAQLMLAFSGKPLPVNGIWDARSQIAFDSSSSAVKKIVSTYLQAEGISMKSLSRALPDPTTKMLEAGRLTVLARQHGITGTSLVNLLATVDAETGFVLRRESHLYTPGRARQMFSVLRDWSDERIRLLIANGRAAFFETVYGHTTEVGKKLGNTLPGDGGRFFGRGLIQLTGRYNYQNFEAVTRIPVVDNPDMLVTDDNAARMSAIFFWKTRVMAQKADLDLLAATRVINPGLPEPEYRLAIAKRYSAVA